MDVNSSTRTALIAVLRTDAYSRHHTQPAVVIGKVNTCVPSVKMCKSSRCAIQQNYSNRNLNGNKTKTLTKSNAGEARSTKDNAVNSRQMIVVLGDQLSHSISSLRNSSKETSLILMAEVMGEATYARLLMRPMLTTFSV